MLFPSAVLLLFACRVLTCPSCGKAAQFTGVQFIACRVIQSRHLSRPTENEDEGDTRSEVSNRQPKGDVIGDDLPPALIEVCSCCAS